MIGIHHPGTLNTIKALAWLYGGQGRVQEAQIIRERAFIIVSVGRSIDIYCMNVI